MVLRFLQIERIGVFFSKRSGREKILIGGALLAVGGLLVNQMVLEPVANTFQALDRQREALQLEIRETVHVLSQKNRMDDERTRYAAYLGEEKSTEEESISFLKHVEELARKTAVNLIYVKPAEEKTEGRIKKYFVSLECESEPVPLARFFYEIESSPRLLKIEKYSLVPIKDGSRVMKVSAVLSRAVVT